jgi:hypothetical protein
MKYRYPESIKTPEARKVYRRLRREIVRLRASRAYWRDEWIEEVKKTPR